MTSETVVVELGLAEQKIAGIVSRCLLVRQEEVRNGQAQTGTPNGIAQEILAALASDSRGGGADRSALQQALAFCLGSMGEYGEGTPEFTAYKNCHTFIARLARNCQPEQGGDGDWLDVLIVRDEDGAIELCESDEARRSFERGEFELQRYVPAPTQPSISATFRQRLGEIAAVIEDNDDSRFHQTDAGFLRHLASAPPGAKDFGPRQNEDGEGFKPADPSDGDAIGEASPKTGTPPDDPGAPGHTSPHAGVQEGAERSRVGGPSMPFEQAGDLTRHILDALDRPADDPSDEESSYMQGRIEVAIENWFAPSPPEPQVDGVVQPDEEIAQLRAGMSHETERANDLQARLEKAEVRLQGVGAVDEAARRATHATRAEAELTSLRSELATLLGPRKPREGVTANDQWIAAVGDVLRERDRLREKAALKMDDADAAALRAEVGAVVDEAAAEFERRAEEQVRHSGEWVETRMAALTYRAAAQLLREEQAALKGGGADGECGRGGTTAFTLRSAEADLEAALSTLEDPEQPALSEGVGSGAGDEDAGDLCCCGRVRHEHRYFPYSERGPETGGCSESGCERFEPAPPPQAVQGEEVADAALNEGQA